MLRNTLRQAWRAFASARARPATRPDTDAVAARQVPGPERPLELEAELGALHGRAPVREHLDRLYAGLSVGDEPFVDAYTRCLARTGTAITPFTVFHRFQTRVDLLQYFRSTFAIEGARGECGVYRGATSMLLCDAWRAHDPSFSGAGFYMIDSFSGTSESLPQDHIPVRGDDGVTRMQPFFPPGRTDTSPDLVRGFFAGYPQARVCSGWIPQVFDELPDGPWAFVHLDLSLYQPTLAALAYFQPRLARGGVLFCDGSLFCPGVEKAWAEYCRARGLAWVTLGHRTTVLIG